MTSPPPDQPVEPRKGRSLVGFYIGLGVVVAVLLGVGAWMGAAPDRGEPPAYDPKEIVACGDWGQPADGLSCRLLLCSYGARHGAETEMTLVIEVKNTGSARKAVEFGSPFPGDKGSDHVLIHVFLNNENRVNADAFLGIVRPWSSGSILQPSALTARKCEVKFGRAIRTESLGDGAFLEATIWPWPHEHAQQKEITSGKLFLTKEVIGKGLAPSTISTSPQPPEPKP